MSGISKAVLATALIAFLAGAAAGAWVARSSGGDATDEPDRWVARIGESYITEEAFVDEMKRRGGDRPGQYQEVEQRRQLLDDLIYRAALVEVAEREGLTAKPEMKLAVEQVVSNRYLQTTLREMQREVVVTDEEVRKYYEANASDYEVPARKRVAMIKVSVPKDAMPSQWDSEAKRLEEARASAMALDSKVPHFGALASKYSDDNSTRHRGGVIGWVAEGTSSRYSYDPVVLKEIRQMEGVGTISHVLRGADGLYLLRLVESEPRQTRAFEYLADGIRQGLVRARINETEKKFRQSVIRGVGVEVRDSVLASILPLSSPAQDNTPQPPTMPKDQG